MAAYRNTPHTTTGEKPSKLMFGRDVQTKLPRDKSPLKGKHHEEARKKEEEAKMIMKTKYDKKKRVRQTQIHIGDWAYIQETAPSTMRGPWERYSFRITQVIHNKITGIRDGEIKTRSTLNSRTRTTSITRKIG